MAQEDNKRKPLRLLIVEDVEDDALLLVDFIRSAGMEIDSRLVDNERDMREAMRQHWDIVCSDYSMPAFSGERALQVLREHKPDTPFIFVSGTIGEEVAVEAMKAGAQDYVIKGQLTRLPHVIERELREVVLRRERRETQETLRKLSLVVEQAIDSVFITDPEGRIEYVNPAFEGLTGYRSDEVLGRTPALLRSGNHGADYYKRLWETVKRGEIFRGTIVNRRKDGGLFYEEKVIAPLKNEQGRITHFVSTGRDVTPRIKAEEARARLAAILEATPDLVAILEPDGRLRYVNGAGRKLLGLRDEENVERHTLRDIFPESIVRQFEDHIFPAVERDGAWSGEILLPMANGTEIPLSQVVLAHHDAEGRIEYLSTIGRDLSERKRFEAELHHRATHDQLTNLPNRLFLLDRFGSALDHAQRHGRYVAVLFLDMDNFKRVNDSLGHAAGDQLLQHVAQRLSGCLRSTDIVARHGGDEFAIMVADLAKVEDILIVLKKIRAAFDGPVLVEGQEVYATFSIGIACYPHDGSGVGELLRHADTAMYAAKAAGSNQYRFYAPDMNARSHELLALEAELRHAVEHEALCLHYQPQLDMESGRISGAEALIRWHHPSRGLIGPADFIPILENTGLIIPAGEWVLREACRMHRKLRDAGLGRLRICVNVSAVQFNDAELVNKVLATIRNEEVPPQMLELEITENIIMRDPIQAAETLRAFQSLGVRIALDDFGTGYSSLAYLKNFPLDTLKIDQGFVRGLTTDPKDAAIVEAGIFLARKLGLEVVAEGVESAEQARLLRGHGCSLAQGYHFGRPMPAEEFMAWLASTPHYSAAADQGLPQ